VEYSTTVSGKTPDTPCGQSESETFQETDVISLKPVSFSITINKPAVQLEIHQVNFAQEI